MAENRRHRSGRLCWADLVVSEPDAAERFYAQVFGWDYLRSGRGAHRIRYACVQRHLVAGILQADPGTASWIVAFATDDADALAERVRRAGGAVKDPPRDVGIQGRSVTFADPHGGFLCGWQARAHVGTGLTGEPGSLCWTELLTPDLSGADAFYRSVFDWHTSADPASAESGHRNYCASSAEGAARAADPIGDPINDQISDQIDDQIPVAGRSSLPSSEIEPFWTPYFAHRDVTSACRVAERGGGELIHRTRDRADRELAMITDPWGATFALLGLSS